MKKTLLTLALSLLAGSVLAQTWNATGTANNSRADALITSSTTPKGVPIGNSANKVWVFLKGSAIASATVKIQDDAGNTLDSVAVAVPNGTYTSVTLPAPQVGTRIVVSQSTLAGGNNNISASIVQKDGL